MTLLPLLTNNPSATPSVSGTAPMCRDDIIAELRVRFAPLIICSSVETINSLILKAVRLFNRFSGIVVIENVLGLSRHGTFNIPDNIKNIIRMDPILKGPPRDEISTLLGVDLITTRPLEATHERYWREWQREFNSTFGFKFEYMRDGRQIRFANLPNRATGLAIKGLQPIDVLNGIDDPENFCISDETALEFILDYTEALLKIHEGEILRKAVLLGVTVDADSMVDEGRAEAERLLNELKSRALIFMGR